MFKSSHAAKAASSAGSLAAETDTGTVLNTTEARQGEGRARTGWVLGASVALIILAFGAVYLVTMVFSANQ